jgi:hypothetical protein
VSDVTAAVKTVRALLRQTYLLGAYQRDFVWQAAEVEALLRDLLSAYRPRIGEIGQKGYFLGPMMTKLVEGRATLIDGQQRLTSLLILLVAIRRRLQHSRKRARDALALFSEPHLRAEHMTSMFADAARTRLLRDLDSYGDLKTPPETDGERNILARFKQVEEFVTLRIADEELVGFARWVLDKVSLVDIVAGASHDPFALFDAMNTRGQPLRGIDQFKLFLGARIVDEAARAQALEAWSYANDIVARTGAGGESDFVKSWLAARSLELDTPTPDKPADARKLLDHSVMAEIDVNAYFFAIHNADSMPELGLDDANAFIGAQWQGYAEVFARVRAARRVFDPRLESMFFIEALGFDLDLFDEILMLAAHDLDRPEDARLRACAQFLENLAARFAWTAPKGSSVRALHRLKYLTARAAGEVRGLPLADLAAKLMALQGELGFDFSDVEDRRHSPNGPSPQLRVLLARMTAFLDEVDGRPGRYQLYATRSGPDAHDLEHLLPKTYRRAAEELGHDFKSDEYRTQRHRLGALVVLPEGLNKELADSSYAAKRTVYATRSPNPLVGALFGGATQSPALAAFYRAHGINFPNAPILDRKVIDQRQQAYLRLAGLTWAPERIKTAAGL